MAYFHCLIGGGSSGGGYELTVTCDAGFAGTTITCTDGVTTLTQTCPSSSPYEVVFAIPNGGEWTISGVVGGRTVSTGVNIPTSASLIAIVQQTVTIYSAKEDTISYTDIDGATQTITFASGETSKQVQITIEANGSAITFTSSVAKNPNNLSQDYSKTFTITTSTTELYLMPDAVKKFYWYGYEPNAMTAIASAATDMAQTAPTITNNTNSKSVSQTKPSRGCGYYQTTNEGTVLHIIYSASAGQAYTYNSIYASMSDTNNKMEAGVANIELLRNSTSVSTTHKQATITNKNYVIIQLTADNANVSLTLNALWLE